MVNDCFDLHLFARPLEPIFAVQVLSYSLCRNVIDMFVIRSYRFGYLVHETLHEGPLGHPSNVVLVEGADRLDWRFEKSGIQHVNGANQLKLGCHHDTANHRPQLCNTCGYVVCAIACTDTSRVRSPCSPKPLRRRSKLFLWVSQQFPSLLGIIGLPCAKESCLIFARIDQMDR